MLYRWIFLQLLVLHIKLYISKMYLQKVDAIDVLSDETESIVFLLSPPRRSKSLSIEDLEPSKSLVRHTNPKQDDIMMKLNLSKQQKEMLRKRWQNSCDKKASKVCIKACKSTAKIVCSSYKCKKSMKRSFKKECKRNCKASFISSKDSSETE